jgi:hypothetical protein
MALAGCESGFTQVVTTCTRDRDCATHDVCVFGECVDPSDQRLSSADLEIEPPPDAQLQVQAVFGVDLRSTARVDVNVRRTVVLEGQALSGGQPLLAHVLAAPATSIAGRALAPADPTDASTGTFRIPLVDGDSYTLSVVPDDVTLPPLTQNASFVAAGDAVGVLDVGDVVLPDVLHTVIGRVVSGSDARAVPGVDVELDLVAGGRVSSRARTDANGAFTVHVPTVLSALTLTVRGSADNAFVPTVVQEGVFIDHDTDLGSVSLGDLQAPLAVVLHVVDGAGAPVANARVFADATVGTGTFAVQADANAQGLVSLTLPPGSYDVAAAAPDDNVVAGLLVTTSVVVAATPAEATLTLPARTVLQGVVTDVNGAPVANAAVTTTRIGGSGGAPEPSLQGALRVSTGSTDDQGRFAVHVDAGRHRLTVIPVVGDTKPMSTEVIDVGVDALAHDVTLAKPAFLAGAVSANAGPVAGAYVRVFSALVDERGAAILLGQGLAGSDGTFNIVLPDVSPATSAGSATSASPSQSGP